MLLCLTMPISKRIQWSGPVVNSVAGELMKSEIYHELLNKLQDLLNDSDVTADTLEEQMRLLLTESGYKTKIRNMVYQHVVKNPDFRSNIKQPKEPLDFLQKAQLHWERRVIKSLNNMCSELGITFSRKRSVSEQKEFEAKWSELGTEDLDLSQFRPVYSPKDFLDVLVNAKNPNVCSAALEAGVATVWGQIKVPLRVKDLKGLRREFEELSGNFGHLGIDLQPFSKLISSSTFLKERVTLGKQVLESNQAPLAREYCKRGCPATLRAEMWALMLSVESSNTDRLNFQHLKSCVIQHDLMIDKLLIKDIHLTASNDDQYFVFEDLLYQILLVFSRDTSVRSHFEKSSASPLQGVLLGTNPEENKTVIYPPNGVIAFHGFSMYVAPLCYIYEDPVTLYLVFKEIYCRYFFRLHNLSSHSQGILSLCLLFENLLHEVDPQIAYHFAYYDILPLKIVIKWLMRAYSGYLATDQILQLWDCILAYNSTEILAVLAVAIMSFRKVVLLQADNQAAAECVLSDISNVRVVPLLCGMLSATRNSA